MTYAGWSWWDQIFVKKMNYFSRKKRYVEIGIIRCDLTSWFVCTHDTGTTDASSLPQSCTTFPGTPSSACNLEGFLLELPTLPYPSPMTSWTIVYASESCLRPIVPIICPTSDWTYAFGLEWFSLLFTLIFIDTKTKWVNFHSTVIYISRS